MAKSNNPERRSTRRVIPKDQLDSQTLSGHFKVADIGAGGLRMYSDEAMDPGETLEMELDLNSGTPVLCSGTVIWLKPLEDGSPAKYDLGVAFDDLPTSARTSLDTFLNSH